MNIDNSKIEKIIRKFNQKELNENNVEQFLDCLNQELFYFQNTTLSDFENTLKDNNIDININIKDYLELDTLYYTNHDLKKELLDTGFTHEDIKIQFPDLID